MHVHSTYAHTHANTDIDTDAHTCYMQQEVYSEPNLSDHGLGTQKQVTLSGMFQHGNDFITFSSPPPLV